MKKTRQSKQGVKQGGSARDGFTMVEALVALAVMAVIMLLGAPSLMNAIHRSKIEGITRQAAVMVQQARMETIKSGLPSMVIADTTTREFIAFVDDFTDPPNRAFDEGNERVLGRFFLPSGVTFTAPGTQDAIDFTLGDGPIFQSDGSVLENGSLRIGDTRGNFLEIRIEPAATARSTVRKWDGSQWHTSGQGGRPWEWK